MTASPRTHLLGLLLHYAGLSARDTAFGLTQLREPVSRAPISDWHHRAAELFDEPRSPHDVLAVDEAAL